MQLKPQVLPQQSAKVHNSRASFFCLKNRLKEIRVHYFSNNFTFFILINEDMLLPQPIHLLPFLPQKDQSPDHIGQYLGDCRIAEGALSLVEQHQVSLKGVVWPFEYGIDIGDNRAEVVGLHGVRIHQSDYVCSVILLELAELDEQLVVLL